MIDTARQVRPLAEPSIAAPSGSRLGLLYSRVYAALCGEHPNLRPWHFQWLDGYYLYKGLRRTLSGMTGTVLDAGCGASPYRAWLGPGSEYIGLDVIPGPTVDIVVAPDERWPFPDQRFDVLLSSQVLEHVENLVLTLTEMHRVVKPGGHFVLTFPFIYNEHGVPFDFQRFTAYRAARILPNTEVVLLERQGAIGSTLVILILNWIEQALNSSRLTRVLKALLLPLWLPFSFLLNMLGLLGDAIDPTEAYYNNLLVVLRKAGAPPHRT